MPYMSVVSECKSNLAIANNKEYNVILSRKDIFYLPGKTKKIPTITLDVFYCAKSYNAQDDYHQDIVGETELPGTCLYRICLSHEGGTACD